MWTLTVDIFEGKDLVVRHIFYGRTQQRAFDIYQAHMKSDQFLRECVERSCYDERVRCEATYVWGRT